MLFGNEGLNKVYGTEIILSDDTAVLVPGAFLLRELDLVRVKGRQQALRIHELLGPAEMPLPPEQKEMLALYAAGMTAYRARRWDPVVGPSGKPKVNFSHPPAAGRHSTPGY